MTGKDNYGSEHAEIFKPNTNTRCTLPDLPEKRVGHTQDGGLTCGGGRYDVRKTCVKWNPISGTWNQSHTLRELRKGHKSWATASGVYLLGGYDQVSKMTSEKVNMDGSVEEGFSLKYDVYGSCGIPDPDNEEIIITGGPSMKTVSVYSEAGWQRDLTPGIDQDRFHHACSSYVNGGKKVSNIVLHHTCWIDSFNVSLSWSLGDIIGTIVLTAQRSSVTTSGGLCLHHYHFK